MNIAPGRSGGSTPDDDDDEQDDTGGSSTSSSSGSSSSGSSSGARPDAGDTRPSRGRDTAGTTTPSTDAFEDQTQATDEPRSDAGHTTPDDEGGSPTRDIEAGETDEVAASRAVERSRQVQSAQRRGEDPAPAGGRRREAGETDDAAARAATERSGQLQDAQRRRDQFRSDVADEIDGVEEDDLRLVEQDGEIVAELDASDDDLPRVSDLVDGGGAEFRRDTLFRSGSERVAERGAELGSSAFVSGIRFAGGGAAEQRVGEAAGASIGGLPGALGLVASDIDDAGRSIVGAGSPTDAAEQTRDLGVDTGDFLLGGLDRTFDVDSERRESGEGALVEFDTTGTRGEETAGALFGGALLLGASGPTSVGTRAALGRAPSPGGTTQSLTRFARDDRAQTQVPRGQRRDRDGDDSGAVESGFNEDVRADLRQDSLTQTQDQLRPQARRERRAESDVIDDPAGPDPLDGGGGRGPTFDPDAPQPTGPSRFGQQRQAGQEVPRGFADVERAGNVPRTDLRATTTEAAAASGRFRGRADAGAAVGGATGAGANEATRGPQQPNPGGLVVDERGDIRGVDEPNFVGEEQTPGLLGTTGTQDAQADTAGVETVADGVTGVGVDTSVDDDTISGVESGTDVFDVGDTGTDTRGESETGFDTPVGSETGMGSETRPATDAPGQGPTSPGLGNLSLTPRATATPQTQTRPSSRRRLLPQIRPAPRTGRARPPEFDFGGDDAAIAGGGLALFGASDRADDGGPVVGFGAETIDALARGAFRQRELPDEIGTGPSPEIPTAGLVDPDPDEEEAVSFVSDLFGLEDAADNDNQQNSGLFQF